MDTRSETRNPAGSRSSAKPRSFPAAAGLTEPQLTVIAEIEKAGKTGVSPREIAKAMGVGRERARKLINSLPSGLVVERADPSDRRQHLYTVEAGTIVTTQVSLPGGHVLAQLPGNVFVVYPKSGSNDRPMIIGCTQDKLKAETQPAGSVDGESLSS